MSAVQSEPWSKNPKIVDLMDLDVFSRGVPFDQFKILREEYPVYWNEEYGAEPGFWNLTRYEDIVAVSNDTDTYSSARGVNIFYDPSAGPAITGALIGNMITMDPPMHTDFRKIAAPFFTLRAVRALKDRVVEMTGRILDDVARESECEFMQDIAARLPIGVLCHILGVPESDHEKIFDWSNKMVGIDDPEINPVREESFATMMEVFAYGQHLVQSRRQDPKDDLMTAMALARHEDSPIPPVLLDGFFLLMVIAGNETTRNTMTGGMLALIEHPDQREKVLDNRQLIPSAVDEILRWVSPVAHMRRTATRRAVIRDTEIAEGDKVVMWYGSANRDETLFANPEAFEVTREPNEHLAFGMGRHRCLGAHLARLQLQIMFNELLKRFPEMELNGEVKRLRSNFISGIREMPVRF